MKRKKNTSNCQKCRCSLTVKVLIFNALNNYGGNTMGTFRNEGELLNLIRNINTHMNHELSNLYSPYGLTRPQAIILARIEQQGPLSVGTLAEQLNMTRSNCCLIAQRLEKNGYLIRQRCMEDQRTVLLSNTEKSHQMIHLIENNVNSIIDSKLNTASDEEIGKIMEGLELLYSVMLRTRGDKK